jgi:glucose-6-phosphate isomerase
MPVVQSVEKALAGAIGTHGLADETFHEKLSALKPALADLRAQHADGSLPLLRYPEKQDDFPSIREAAAKLANGATDIIVLGTGGSSLGAQCLAQLADGGVPGLELLRGAPRMHFLDNLDPLTMEALLAKLPLQTTHTFAVSKSGGTGETLMQTIAVLDAYDRRGLGERTGELMLGLSEPRVAGRKNGLRDLLEPRGVPFLPHDPGVGGRYSVLTNVGMVPAAALGIDIAAIRAGAAEALAPILEGQPPMDVPAAIGAALAATAAGAGRPITVMMAYADRLDRFTAWYTQLWSESLGKDGSGTTPVRALGPVDQHSQLQLYLGGPGDKLFTILSTDVKGRGPRLDAASAQLAGEPGFGGKTVGDLVAAESRATADTLVRRGRPVREMRIEKLDARSLGYLLMHFMLETILTARLIGVDAFDQPAVEEGKILAKQYLAEG